MKVIDLIALLQATGNEEAEIEIEIHQFNKVYPIHYGDISNDRYLNQVHGKVRLSTWLPDNMYTVLKKQ